MAYLGNPYFVSNGVPTGTVKAIASASVPTGYLKCDGTAVSRTTYATLFATIGTTYGAGDGSTTFNLPDLRGEFLRGLDDGRGVDSGRTNGSAQGDAFQGHWHTVTDDYGHSVTVPNGGSIGNLGVTPAHAPDLDSTYYMRAKGTITDGSSGTPRTATETRPRNVAMVYVIKF